MYEACKKIRVCQVLRSFKYVFGAVGNVLTLLTVAVTEALVLRPLLVFLTTNYMFCFFTVELY